MTFKRDLPESVIREMNRQNSAEAYPIFLTITHPTLDTPIRVVSDPKNFMLDGNFYRGFRFGIRLVTDTEEMPYAELTIQNVDKKLSDALLDIDVAPRLDFDVIALNEYFNSQTIAMPRGPIKGLFEELGVDGAWFDAGPHTCFQNDDFTLPAGDGDPVRSIIDLSGNGNHGVIANTANPMTLHTDGTRWWLHSTGAGAILWATSTEAQQETIVAAVRAETAASSIRNIIYSQNSRSALYKKTDDIAYEYVRLDGSLVTYQYVSQNHPSGTLIDEDTVVRGQWDGTNGIAAVNTSINTASFGTVSNSMNHGFMAGTGEFQQWVGRVYSAVVFHASLNSTQLALVNSFMNTRMAIPDTDLVARMYQARYLYLTEVNGDPLSLSGRIRSWDYSQEPYPGVFATQDRCPALFR